MFKKILLAFLAINILFSTLLTPVAKAQNSWYDVSFPEWYIKVYDQNTSPPDEIFGERYAAAQTWWVVYGLWSFVFNHLVPDQDIRTCILGMFTQSVAIDTCVAVPLQALFTTLTGMISDNSRGVNSALADNPNRPVPVQFLNKVFVEDRPLSGIGYVKSKLRNFHIIPEAQAQAGFGFAQLGLIQELWIATRNIAYAFMVILIIAFSFMIMFRMKLSPQTVITVQSALPRIIIAMLLITFSFAISGFLIDLVYVVIGIVAAAFASLGSFDNIYRLMTTGLPVVGGGFLPMMFVYFALFSFVASVAIIVPFTFTGVVATFTGINMIIAFLLILGVAIALFFVTFKLAWLLIKTLTIIVLLIIVAPIYILVGGFSNWFKSMIANLAVYPLVSSMFLIAIYFLFYSMNALINSWAASPLGTGFNTFVTLFGFDPLSSQTFWTPPLTIFATNPAVMFVFVSLGVMMLIPSAATIVKSMIERRPFAAGSAIGAPVTAAFGILSKPVTQPISVMQEAFRKSQIEAIQNAQGGLDYLRGIFGRKSKRD